MVRWGTAGETRPCRDGAIWCGLARVPATDPGRRATIVRCRHTSKPCTGTDIAPNPVNVNGYVKSSPTRSMTTVPYSFGEAAS
jgi:hypothetical protein